MDIKPKCALCKQVGEDKYYYWVADKRGKGGKWFHLTCALSVQKTIGKRGNTTIDNNIFSVNDEGGTLEIIISPIKKGGKKIFCHFCHKPIHIDHLGGTMKSKGEEIWFCDNICCVVEFNEMLEKEEAEIVVKEEG